MEPHTPLIRPQRDSHTDRDGKSHQELEVTLDTIRPFPRGCSILGSSDSLLLSPTCATSRYRRLHTSPLDEEDQFLLKTSRKLEFQRREDFPSSKLIGPDGRLPPPLDSPNKPEKGEQGLAPTTPKSSHMQSVFAGKGRFHPYSLPVTPSRYVMDSCGKTLLSTPGRDSPLSAHNLSGPLQRS